MKAQDQFPTLWRLELAKDVDVGSHAVKEGTNLFGNLGELVDYCLRLGGEFLIAKVECKPSHVSEFKTDRGSSPIIYQALTDLESKEGFMPLGQAADKYRSYIQNA